MSPAPYRLYNRLIRRGIDDRDMYRCAAAEVGEPGLRALFSETADSLGVVIDELQRQVSGSGHLPARHGTALGTMRLWLIEHLHGRHTPPRDRHWIARLIRSESELLHAVEQRLPQLPPEAARVLRRQLPRLHGIHLDMHSLARAAALR